MRIRPETPYDISAIRDINIAAFADLPISNQTEHLIVEALRAAGALEISLVADADSTVVGHVALSLGKIGETSEGWYLLGPIAVLPEWQGRGVGRALMEAALAQLRARGAAGCILVGDPDFYERFGFKSYAGVTCEGVPPRNVLVLPLAGEVPDGEIWHHPAYWTQPE